MNTTRLNEKVAFLIDSWGQIATWNDACMHFLGHSAKDILGKNISGLLDEAGQRLFREYIDAPTCVSGRWRVEVARADGDYALCNLILVPQAGAPGINDFFCAILDPRMDVRTASERELIGQIPMTEMTDFLAGTFYVINRAGHFVLWNQRVELATGRSADELKDIHVLDLFAPHEQNIVGDKIRTVFEQDGEVLVEAHLLSKTGKPTPYIFSGCRFVANGNFFLVGMGLDVSERQEHLEQLRLRDRALHASSNGIIITRCVGRKNSIEYVNAAFERITGYKAEEAIGHDARFLAAPGLDDCERTKLRIAINERREASVIIRNLRKSGELFWNALTITPVLDEKGVATHFIGVLNDVTESIHRTSHLEHELNHDALTGLANRNLLWDRLEQAVHVAQRNKSLVATLMVDLDNFKEMNDTLGHDGGDEILKVVAKRLQASIRDSDTVARLGGDEFVLVLENQPSLRYTMRMIDRVRENMAKVAVVNGKEVTIRMSLGASVFPHDGSSVTELIQAADVAMYHAKTAGRNDVHFFSSDMKLCTESKKKMDTSMRNAIDKNELFLAFQPRICLRSGRIVGAEALLRWRHPEQGILLPAAFLPEAEDSGLIKSIGEWVLNDICSSLQRVRHLGFDELVVSMNVSFNELCQKNYVAMVANKLNQSSLPFKTLELEVKEVSLTRNPNLTKDLFGEIQRLGIKLAIDECGAGLSSLRNLHELGISHLKIPRAFVDSIGVQNTDGIMAKTMIGIGHNMNIGVVAEGVETGIQLNFLKQNDCDEMQGNYACEPLSISGLEQLLKTDGAELHMPVQ
ncbi:MAG TPA: bifunctional diguanylate cyclase/phosphodiesterase [Janthinobacterium sp.]|nr:bifunctional diguanylate cyclase/phosphodiesterase [Janthinobacterium sp.]